MKVLPDTNLKVLWGTSISGSHHQSSSRYVSSLTETELLKVKEESEKVGLKLNIQETKIMASSPINSWQIDWGNSDRLYFGAPKSLQMVTAAMKLKDAFALEEKL